MTPEQRRMLGVAAKALLNDETVKLALEEVENAIHTEWATAMFSKRRERLHAELAGLQRLRSRLASMASQAPRN